jgi:hypothetical protein
MLARQSQRKPKDNIFILYHENYNNSFEMNYGALNKIMLSTSKRIPKLYINMKRIQGGS